MKHANSCPTNHADSLFLLHTTYFLTIKDQSYRKRGRKKREKKTIFGYYLINLHISAYNTEVNVFFPQPPFMRLRAYSAHFKNYD